MLLQRLWPITLANKVRSERQWCICNPLDIWVISQQPKLKGRRYLPPPSSRYYLPRPRFFCYLPPLCLLFATTLKTGFEVSMSNRFYHKYLHMLFATTRNFLLFATTLSVECHYSAERDSIRYFSLFAQPQTPDIPSLG